MTNCKRKNPEKNKLPTRLRNEDLVLREGNILGHRASVLGEGSHDVGDLIGYDNDCQAWWLKSCSEGMEEGGRDFSWVDKTTKVGGRGQWSMLFSSCPHAVPAVEDPLLDPLKLNIVSILSFLMMLMLLVIFTGRTTVTLLLLPDWYWLWPPGKRKLWMEKKIRTHNIEEFTNIQFLIIILIYLFIQWYFGHLDFLGW